jgi:uncharacterized membrane protein
MTPTPRPRNNTIDILRGIAIFTMVAANFSASLLQAEDKVLAFRLYGTFAAPLFILLAGMMVVMTQTRHHRFSHYLHRGLFIIGVACLLDIVIWQLWPLLGYDVLYLTGLAIPCVAVLSRYCQPTARLILAAILLLSAPALQKLFGYREELVSVELAALSFPDYLHLLFSASTAQRLLLDGWFPLVPWLGFALVGSALGSYTVKGYALTSRSLLIIGLTTASIGIAIWLWQQPHLVIREGYSELFYPPSIGYALTACGLILTGFYAVAHTQHWALHQPFLKLGHASLFMYLFHQLFLVTVLKPIAAFNNLPLVPFLLLYVTVISLMVAIGYGLAVFKQRQKNLPFIVRFLLGG